MLEKLAVTLVPREKFSSQSEKYSFVDEKFVMMPFCSHNLLLGDGHENILRQFFAEKVFLRQRYISQLQNLTPESSQQNVFYSFPVFPHKRYDHAKMAAMMAAHLAKILKISWEAAFTFVFAMAFHDTATVAGGDAIRCAFEELCEERNFSECMRTHGLDLKYQAVGLDLAGAQSCVDGQGLLGELTDRIDKISYTILDTYFLGGDKPVALCNFLKRYPLFGDVWLDMGLTENGKVYFSDPKRLYAFLMVRALMHVHLYKNPACRRIEHIVAKETRQLLKRGIISFDALKREDDRWLSKVLEEHGCRIRGYMTPDIVNWKRFENKEQCQEFVRGLGERVVLTEQIKPFKTGIDWLVKKGKQLAPLKEAILGQQAYELEKLSKARAGWYAYFYANI